jgi:hypothetical protein
MEGAVAKEADHEHVVAAATAGRYALMLFSHYLFLFFFDTMWPCSFPLLPTAVEMRAIGFDPFPMGVQT